MGDKTALVLLSEIGQSLDEIRYRVTGVFESVEEGKGPVLGRKCPTARLEYSRRSTA